MYATLFGAVLMLMSCGPDEFLIRRDMYANVNRTPKVRLEVDWLTLFGSKPTGMTVMMDGIGGNSFGTTTNSVDGVDLSLDKDSYHTLVYNLSSDEFGSLDFYNTDSYDSINVKLTPITMRANAAWDEGVRYMREPEDIGVALDTIDITPEMVENYSALIRQRLSEGITGDRSDTVLYVFHETVFPVVSKLNVIVRVLGLSNAASVEGSIDGMADGFYLSQLHASAGKGTHYLDNWTVKYDSASSKNGYIYTTINTFALPYGTEDVVNRDSTLNYLTLNFNLADGKTTKQYRYAVGSMFKYINGKNLQNYSTGVTLELELRIDADSREGSTPTPVPNLPDVTPGGNTGTGFDAHVEDWENGGTYDIGM